MDIETVNDIKIIKISRSLSHSLIPGILAQRRAQPSIAGHFSTLLCSQVGYFYHETILIEVCYYFPEEVVINLDVSLHKTIVLLLQTYKFGNLYCCVSTK